MSFNEHGDPKVTITLEGWSDVYRFADRMTELQCEFAHEGRKILRACRRRFGKPRYRRYQEHLHGRVKHA
jgi:predicted HicB family RNase H-like nuclease